LRPRDPADVNNLLLCPRNSSWAKPAVFYALSGAIACIAGVLFAGWRTLPDFLGNLVWLWATAQFVYDIMVRPLAAAAKKANASRKLGPSVHKR